MATVDIGSNSYEAFADADFADEYLAADILRADGWATLSDDNKGRALVSATRFLLALPWCAEAPSPSATDLDPAIPEVAAMLAADLAANPELFNDASGSSNIKRTKAGSAEVEFFSPVDGGPPMPRKLWDRLIAANLICPGDGAVAAVLDGAVPFGTSDCVRPLSGRPPWDWWLAEWDYD